MTEQGYGKSQISPRAISKIKTGMVSFISPEIPEDIDFIELNKLKQEYWSIIRDERISNLNK